MLHSPAHLVPLAALLVTTLLVAGCAPSWDRPPLRIHLMASTDLRALDGAGAIDEAELLERIAAVNDIFAPAGVRWVVDSIEAVPAIHEDRALDAIADDRAGMATLAHTLPEDELLSPDGWDLVVVRNTAVFGFGGVFTCGVGGAGGPAAAFVPVTNSGGQEAQDLRKWAHELGHASGLAHTPCNADWTSNLMMSGRCAPAELDRVGFSADQLRTMKRRLRKGHPSLCKP